MPDLSINAHIINIFIFIIISAPTKDLVIDVGVSSELVPLWCGKARESKV